MTHNSLLLPIVMAIAELAGAALFVATRSSARRTILSCFGLGFALCIVVADIIPDATEDYPLGWLLATAGAAVSAALMFGAGGRGSIAGRAAGLAGMALHNIGEGIVMAAAGPAISPLIFTAAVAHKLPEGMVVFSLADRLALGRRWALAALMSLLIPIGTTVVVSEEIQKPMLAVAAGVLFVVLAKALILIVAPDGKAAAAPSRRAIAVATAGGAALAGLTCLVI